MYPHTICINNSINSVERSADINKSRFLTVWENVKNENTSRIAFAAITKKWIRSLMTKSEGDRNQEY